MFRMENNGRIIKREAYAQSIIIIYIFNFLSYIYRVGK